MAQIAVLTGQPIDEVKQVSTQLDVEAPFGPQIVALADRVGLSPEEWQTSSIIIVPPGMSPAAVLLLAELHGRMGYFPPCVRLRSEGVPPRFVPAEILDLQKQRQEARTRR